MSDICIIPTQEQIDETIARVKEASIYDRPNQLAIKDCKILLAENEMLRDRIRRAEALLKSLGWDIPANKEMRNEKKSV